MYKVLNQPAILLKDLELIKDVLTVNFESFHDNDFVVNETLDPLISQNPFAAAGANWKVARTNMAPLFTLSKVCVPNVLCCEHDEMCSYMFISSLDKIIVSDHR